MLRRAALLLATVVAGPVLAEPFSLGDSGLSVDLPAGFSAEASDRPNYDVTIGLNMAGGPQLGGTGKYLCEVAFVSAPANAALDQATINAATIDPARQELVKSMIGALFTLESAQTYEVDGETGMEMIGTPKAGPDAANSRVYLTMLETPKGRTTISCATKAPDLEAALPIFRQVRDATAAP